MRVQDLLEDTTARSFAPSLGTLACWSVPSGPGVRVNSGVRQGSEVTPYYDPMLAKLIVHAAARPEAIARMETALEDYAVIGVETNIPYLLAIVRDPAFRAGGTHVRFLDERFAGWRPQEDLPDEALLALAIRTLAGRRNEQAGAPEGVVLVRTPRSSVWGEVGNWRNV